MSEGIYDFIDKVLPLLFAFSFIAMLVLMANLFLRMKSKVIEPGGYHYAKRYPVRSAVAFGGSLLVIILLSFALKAQARKEIQDYFDHLDPKTTSIQVNGNNVADSATMLKALHIPADIWAHHSHPVNRITILITAKDGPLMLRLGRDSQEPKEYWVFYPHYRYLEHNEVYRISTALFDQYP